MSLATLRDNLVLLCIETVIFAFFRNRFPLSAGLILTVFWYMKTKDLSFAVPAMIFLIISRPVYTDTKPSFHEGVIDEVKNSYIVVHNGNEKLMIYTEERPLYDATVELKGDYHEITSQKSFYSFDFQKYMAEKGVYYCADEYVIRNIQENFSFRSFIQKKIRDIDNEEVKAVLYRIVFNISDAEQDDFIQSLGFSYLGVIWVFQRIMRRFLSEKQCKQAVCIFQGILCVFYHFPFILMQSLLKKTLALNSEFSRAETFSLSFTAMICLMPQQVHAMAFLFSFTFQFMHLQEDMSRENLLFVQSLIQSIKYSAINPLKTVIYPYLIRISGILWYFAVLQLFMPALPFITVTVNILRIFRIIDLFEINGSCLGFGLVLFISVCSIFRHYKSYARIRIVLFYLFLMTGLFHPFPECTFINVGQGDSILIRGILNTNNILIDTGKPEQWKYLDQYLSAKGIRRLKTFFVTHDDEDHSGNMEAIIEKYCPEKTVTQHFDTLFSGNILFTDINTIQNDDKNQSSLVLYTVINHKRILLMGDADSFTEKTIVRQHPHLQTDILKLSHHGSHTGSSDLFLDTVKPAFGAISCGSYEIYHHPSPLVVQRLLKRHIPYFDTRSEGDITIFFLPGFYLIVTASGKIGFI